MPAEARASDRSSLQGLTHQCYLADKSIVNEISTAIDADAVDWTSQRSVTVPLAVVIERRPGVTRWQKWVAKPVDVFVVDTPVGSERVLRRNGDILHYAAGPLPLVLHRVETDDYLTNIRSPVARVFVGLRPNGETPEQRWQPFLVTASPYHAEAYTQGGDEIIAGVAMPAALAVLVERFCSVHHRSEPFKKRQRVKFHDPNATPFARPPGWKETDLDAKD